MKQFILILFALITGWTEAQLNIHPDLIPQLDLQLAPFYHGVASGDPTAHSVILWTKVTLDKSVTEAEVFFELSDAPTFERVLRRAPVRTTAADDFTLKMDVGDLEENTVYFYRFQHAGIYSIVGRTQTLPEHPAKLNIAFASCSNYEWGYFNNYRFIAEDEEIDLVVHLGDYIYEYGIGVYGDTSIGRVNVPAHEITTLDDYRTRYSLYRLDKDLMKAHQMKPFITTWDDHEIANNAYDQGAQNHQQNEGPWAERAKSARKAYYEWLPVRKYDNEPLYRSFSIGRLANLIILDTRMGGRTEQIYDMDAAGFHDSTRTILGQEQYAWLLGNLESRHTWKIIGNQVPFGPFFYPNEQRGEKYTDGWDGYPHEREKLVRYMRDKALKNVVFVTGDYHESFALENDLDGTASTEDNASVEFVVTSISSANDDEHNSMKEVQHHQERYLANNPHMKYCNNKDHGYLVLHIREEEVAAVFVYASTIRKPEASKRVERILKVRAGQAVIEE